ncbi:protein of unknown function [Burkholderia multivorans]
MRPRSRPLRPRSRSRASPSSRAPRRQDQVVRLPQRPPVRSEQARGLPRRHPADLRRADAALQGRAVHEGRRPQGRVPGRAPDDGQRPRVEVAAGREEDQQDGVHRRGPAAGSHHRRPRRLPRVMPARGACLGGRAARPLLRHGAAVRRAGSRAARCRTRTALLPSSLFRDLQVIFSRYWRSRRGIDPIRRRLAIQLQYVPAGKRHKTGPVLAEQISGHRTRSGSRAPYPGRDRCDLPRSTPVRRARKSAPGMSRHLRTGFQRLSAPPPCIAHRARSCG